MKAGFGRYDITPKVGCELFGFGPYCNRKSAAVRVPLISGQLPYSDIHNELVKYVKELEKDFQ